MEARTPTEDAKAWRNEIEELEERGRAAFLAVDLDTLRGLWSDRLLVNSPIEKIHGKEQVIDLLRRGIVRHVSMDAHIETIARYGDSVVVMGRDEVRNAPEGPTRRRRFTNLWQSEEGSWRLVARQATIVGTS